MKRWELVFKALANINRLKIIKTLWRNQKLNVTQISEKLKISFMATSRHLIILRNFEVIVSSGEKGHIIYSVNPSLPKDFQKVIKSFI